VERSSPVLLWDAFRFCSWFTVLTAMISWLFNDAVNIETTLRQHWNGNPKFLLLLLSCSKREVAKMRLLCPLFPLATGTLLTGTTYTSRRVPVSVECAPVATIFAQYRVGTVSNRQWVAGSAVSRNVATALQVSSNLLSPLSMNKCIVFL
jgi:hypothetical protein